MLVQNKTKLLWTLKWRVSLFFSSSKKRNFNFEANFCFSFSGLFSFQIQQKKLLLLSFCTLFKNGGVHPADAEKKTFFVFSWTKKKPKKQHFNTLSRFMKDKKIQMFLTFRFRKKDLRLKFFVTLLFFLLLFFSNKLK